MDFLQDLTHLFFLNFPVLRILSEKSYKVFIAQLGELIDRCFHFRLIMSVKNGQEKVHKHEEAYHQIENEEASVATLLSVGREHHIGEVRSRQQDKHIEEGVAHGGKAFNTLNSARK